MRGLSLAEAVVGVFVLLSAFVVLSRLFITGLRYSTLVDNQQTAVFLAESQLEDIRGWSAQTHSPGGATPFSDWTGCPGSPGPVARTGFGGYSIVVNSTVHELLTPCTQWESLYTNPAQRRRMQQSCRRVRVTVSWADRTFQLESLVAAPMAAASTVVSVDVTPSGSSSIPQDTQSAFSATAQGPSGALPDVMWVWYLYGVGDGTLQVDRDGAGARLGHYLLDAASPPAVTGYGTGPCVMRAIGRVRGKHVYGDSGAIDLP